MEIAIAIVIILLGIVLAVGMLAVPIVLVWLVIRSLGNSGGGWQNLRNTFATSGAPAGDVRRGQTLQIGAVFYNHCATVGISDEGLYVAIAGSTVLIPWGELQSVGRAPLVLKPMQRLAVGKPSVATMGMSSKLFESIRGRLPMR